MALSTHQSRGTYINAVVDWSRANGYGRRLHRSCGSPVIQSTEPRVRPTFPMFVERKGHPMCSAIVGLASEQYTPYEREAAQVVSGLLDARHGR